MAAAKIGRAMIGRKLKWTAFAVHSRFGVLRKLTRQACKKAELPG
jgi:hypothetical protein